MREKELITVFLVEDEIVIREGIRNTVPWSEEGFDFVGEASDGEIAYPMIQKLKPDILITDIRMPFMDGLELARLVKKDLPHTQIIILSGYDDFHYAQEAIKTGVSEYLLKPVTEAQLMQTVHKVAEMVRSDAQLEKYRRLYDQECEENRRQAKKDYFRNLTKGSSTTGELLSEGRELGLDMAAGCYDILLFCIYEGDNQYGYSEEVNLAIDEIRTLAAGEGENRAAGGGKYPADSGSGMNASAKGDAYLLEDSEENQALLLKAQDRGRMDGLLSQFEQQFQNISVRHPKLSWFCGEGVPCGRVSELGQCLKGAEKAFACRYFRRKNQIVKAGLADSAAQEETLKIGAFDVGLIDRKVVGNFLKTGTQEDAEHFVMEYLERFGEKSLSSSMFRQYIAMDLYLQGASVLDQVGGSADQLAEQCGDFKIMASSLESKEQMSAYLSKVFRFVIAAREKTARSGYSSLIHDATQYIAEHFQDGNLSLNLVAASVNMSPNHFSTVFRQEMGRTFIDYLTDTRMNRACQLLRSTGKKTTEIASDVGYNDPHYFSYIFKKTQNMTPRDFRGRG